MEFNMIHGLVYLSDAVCSISHQELSHILATSTKNNKIHGVTGFLYFNDYQFIQYIEGEIANLNSVYEKIQQDSRHEIKCSIHDLTFSTHLMPKWQMQLFDTSYHSPQIFGQVLLNMTQFLTNQTQLTDTEIKKATSSMLYRLSRHLNQH